jgi:uncharacterized protein (DUF1499 family)
MKIGRIGLLAALLLAQAGCSGTAPGNLGVRDGRLMPCPQSPNCVSSMEERERAKIVPFNYSVGRAHAEAALKEIVLAERGATIVRDGDGYLYAEFRSAVFRFVDDVEFYLPPERRQVEVRSASRLGYWDLGANRRRLERLREMFVAKVAE